MSDYTFGVPVSGGTDWLMQSVGRNNTGDTATAKDGSGITRAEHCYDEREEASWTVTIPTGQTAPKFGELFAYDGAIYRVTSSNRTNSNSQYEQYAVSGTRWIDGGIPASSSSSSST